MVGKEGVKYKPAVIKFIGLKGIPIVKKGANIPSLIVKAARENGVTIEDGDIIIITHKIISKAEGRVINLLRVKPSKIAKAFASELGKDPKLVEVVLREAKGIVRMGNGHLITETKHGFIAAHSGVDLSNVDGGSSAVLLPLNPDESARRIREEIKRLTGRDIAVIITDTQGRPLRKGAVNVAIGASGLETLVDLRGKEDLFGYKLRYTFIAVADELAAAAELVMGQTNESIPVVIVKGYKFKKSEKATAKDLIRPKKEDLFI